MPLILQGATSGSTTIQATDAVTQTITLPNNSGTILTTANTFGAGTGPAFRANRATSQTLANVTWTKIQYNVENFDTANCYDPSTNYRFTPTVAGYYNIQGQITIDGTDGTAVGLRISFNGAEVLANFFTTSSGDYGAVTASDLIYFNGTTDYVEIFGWQSSGTSKTLIAAGTLNTFSGAMVRSA